MTWVRLDDEFAKHPKVLAAGPLGMAMQVAALCYCNSYLTDGFIPRAAVAGLLDFDGLGMRMWDNGMVGGGEDASWRIVADDILAAGLWEAVEGGYRIHDYEDYQPSKADVEAERERNRVAGRKGGLARAAKHPAKQSAKQSDKRGASKAVSEGSSEIQARTRTPSLPPNPRTAGEQETDLEPINPSTTGTPRQNGTNPRARQARTKAQRAHASFVTRTKGLYQQWLAEPGADPASVADQIRQAYPDIADEVLA